ncbi:hypothetical protein ACTWP6_17695 [Mycobacterium sp. 4D054]|uniref:hypothetical protein n=1 Tax=Mycobacterium sp. 4D054 TaxID=3457440 RepID=UPI003FD51A0C
MTTTHDDNATTWRDLADQLTPEQVRRFEHHERLALNSIASGRNPSETVDDIARGFLTEARWEAQQNLADAMIGIPMPAGAESAEHWSEDSTGKWTRLLHGPSRSIDGFDAAVYRTGVQTRDGAVRWSLSVHAEDRDDMTAEQVRQLAATLVEAADELERLAEVQV